jgi:phage terminase small subunit
MYLPNGLTDRKDLFCHEYIIDFNGTQAAIRAGYSSKTANEQASRLLASVKTRQRIDELLEERKSKIEINEKYVLDKLTTFSNANIMDFYDVVNNKLVLKDLSSLPRNITDSIVEIRDTKDGIGLKIIDKKGSVVDIGRYLGMFTDNMNINEETFEDVILKMHNKAKKGAENEAKSDASAAESAKESLPAPILYIDNKTVEGDNV